MNIFGMHMRNVGGDQFDLLDDTNLERFKYKIFSLDKKELEAYFFDGADKNKHDEDSLNLRF